MVKAEEILNEIDNELQFVRADLARARTKLGEAAMFYNTKDIIDHSIQIERCMSVASSLQKILAKFRPIEN